MYDKLATGCAKASGPWKDANRAKKEFAACLGERREYWLGLRSRIFTDQPPDVAPDCVTSGIQRDDEYDAWSLRSRPGTTVTSPAGETLNSRAGEDSFASTMKKQVHFNDEPATSPRSIEDFEKSIKTLPIGPSKASSRSQTPSSILKNAKKHVEPESIIGSVEL
ncbi:hypothetical protein QFC20_006107 [Naganishia adeliensis]|uniref:Uncharacterized protein n=1 Tax=Naganishia adeliensis TaxID=92952 RepID=A0ACC2VER1_9TREE|nr:hypothetical protein QFC20_006107 [Naganishia adeliensis]